MTQEGQALPSPTLPEKPAGPNTATATTTTTATTDPPTETHNQAEQDKLGAGANDEIEEGKQQEEIREGEEEAQQETHGEEEGRDGVIDEGGEGELKEERLDSTGEEDQQTDGGAEGERERTRGEGCTHVEVSSVGEDAACEVEGMKEEEDGKENEEMQVPAEDPQQAERLVP